MIANIKCLGTLLLAIFNTFILLELCECKPNFGIDVAQDGDILDQNNDKLTAVVEPQGTDSQSPKRAWSNFQAWGKRPWDKNFSAWGKRGWENFATWGKRGGPDQNIAQSEPDKRDWSQFASWGKRADGDGKWSNFPFQVWGKRNKEDFQDQLNVDKKWSKFASWGKRDSNDDDLSQEKRKWSQFNAWGKRNADTDLVDKRKWSKFATWGKRDPSMEQSPEYFTPQVSLDGESVELSPEKRKWSKFASWGKRLRNAKTWAALNTWGKRRWSGLVTWGKRSTDMTHATGPDTGAIAQKLIELFDSNGDGTLDIKELNAYLTSLTSLPSHDDVDKDAARE